MGQKLQQLKKQRDAYEQDDDAAGFVETDDKVKALENEMGVLYEAIVNQTAPNISEEEQQILNEYQQKDPAGYELNKEDIIKKLQDLRRIRAKRHQMLNLIQRMVDPEAANDVIQEFEEGVQDMLTEEERKNLPDNQQRLARKYKGKTIEFDHTDKNGKTTRKRAHFKDSANGGLVGLPQEETLKLLLRQKELLSKKLPTEDDKVELALISEELKKDEHITTSSRYDLSMLENASNITIMSEQELLLNQLQEITAVLQDSLTENLTSAINKISESKQKIISIAQDIKDIKTAIQQAQRNTQGALEVNLNNINRRGNFSIETAKSFLEELKIEEAEYNLQLKQFTEGISTLEDNALRIQLIHTTLTNPDIVSNLLNKSATKQDTV